MSAQAASDTGLSGVSGLVADVIARLGEVGVGLLTAAETVFPPIPSEVVLPFAGYLAQRGSLDPTWVLVAATLGTVAGAVALYVLAASLGEERATALLARLPLVDRDDIERASAWFADHGRSAVLLGRLAPGVRSLISLPAGAQRMPLGQFVAYTTAGSLLWNALLVGAGYALGTQWKQVEAYSGWLDAILIAAAVGVVVLLGLRRYRRHRRAQVAAAPARTDEAT
ncbi:MAG: DedA family protein [Nocardioidaceae bacterium]|nr:DedA family protein [Nocardioidaceae bacterium]